MVLCSFSPFRLWYQLRQSWISELKQDLSRNMTKPTKWVCTQQGLRSAWAYPSLIRVFAVRVKKHWILSYPLSAQRRLFAGCTCHFVGFVMLRLIWWLWNLIAGSTYSFTLFMPRHQKVAGYYVIPSEILSVRPSVCLSVRPSVRPSVRQRPPPFLYRQLLLQF